MRFSPNILAAVACTVCVARTALAADPPLNPDAKRHAAESFATGLRAFDQAEHTHDPKLYDDAYYEFAKAYAIYPEDTALWDLAASEVESGRFLEGLRHLHEYDRHQHVSEQPSHPKNKLFRDYVDRATRATGHIVISAPAGASLRVDGQDLGVAPLANPVDVLPGDRVVEASLTDGPHRQSVHALVGQTVQAQFSLTTVPVAPVVPPSATPVPVTTAPDREPTSPNWWSPAREAGVALGGAALVGVVVGAVLRSSSDSQTSRANQLRATVTPGSCANVVPTGECAELMDTVNAANRNATISTISFVVAGAAAIGGVALVLWGAPSPRVTTGAITWTPVISLQNTGLQASF